ncbi:MAG: DUF6796 family protein [Cyclobacteriaceae bacterium]|mgnify:CR=1 FL=1
MINGQSKSILDQEFEIKFSLRSLKFLTYVGVFASVTVITCNTIMFSFGDTANWPQWALNLSYWAGSIVLAFAAVGFIPTYFALRLAGRFWVLASGGFLAYFLALGSSGHGSFFANYSIQQAIHNTPSIKELEALAVPLQTYNNFLLFAAVIFLFLGSVFYSVTVFTKKTMYPKWMALCNPFLIVVLISIPAMIEGAPSIVKIVSKGIGFHLGFILHYILTYNFIRSYLMKSSGEN